MKTKHLIIGSRSSKLAMTQTRYVMDELKRLHPSSDFEIKAIKTVGDTMLDVALSKIGGKGLFTKEIEHLQSPQHWLAWLKRNEQTDTFRDKQELEKYLAKLEKFEKSESAYGNKAITKCFHDNEKQSFTVSFTPEYVGGLANELLLNLGSKVLMMSGTIPDYKMFCQGLGIPENDVEFLRVPSDFPAANRPVYLPKTDIDLSHKHWNANIASACKEINRIICCPLIDITSQKSIRYSCNSIPLPLVVII